MADTSFFKTSTAPQAYTEASTSAAEALAAQEAAEAALAATQAARDTTLAAINDEASQITSVPAGNLSSTNVQDALNELDVEKADDAATTAALATKADDAATTAALATKADDAATTAALATKADDAATTAALAAKAPLASPALSGTPTAPTAAAGTDTTQIATTGFVKAAVDVILGGVSAAFDTLSEIATALATKVVGPASSTDNAIARYDQATGKLVQNSGVLIDDSNNVTGAASVDATTLKEAGTALASKYKTITPACFSAHKNGTDQTGVLSSTLTKVTFGTEIFDVGGYYDTATSKWVPPTGKVRVSAAVLFTSANMVSASLLQLVIYKNGVATATQSSGTSGTLAQGASATALLEVNGTDEIEVYVLLGGAGNKTISGITSSTYFCGEQV